MEGDFPEWYRADWKHVPQGAFESAYFTGHNERFDQFHLTHGASVQSDLLGKSLGMGSLYRIQFHFDRARWGQFPHRGGKSNNSIRSVRHDRNHDWLAIHDESRKLHSEHSSASR